MGSVASLFYVKEPTQNEVDVQNEEQRRQLEQETLEERKRQDAAWDAEYLRVRNEQLQLAAERLGFEKWEEMQPTMNDSVVAPTEELAQKMLACLRCPVCSRVAHEPVETSCCGHVTCRACLRRVKELNMSCPICRNLFVQEKENRLATRLIETCPGKCPFCQHTMCRATLFGHVQNCDCDDCPCFCFICQEPYILKDGESHNISTHPEYVQDVQDLRKNGNSNLETLKVLVRKYRPAYPIQK